MLHIQRPFHLLQHLLQILLRQGAELLLLFNKIVIRSLQIRL